MAPDTDSEPKTEIDGNKIVQGLWIGPSLSTMERLSIESFIKNGHEYHLYIYDEPANVPLGAIKRDASDILSPEMIFQYTHQKSFAGFSNFFRYKLLLERGGWWVDSDMICLRYFDFVPTHVFSSEVCNEKQTVNCGAIKVPAGSTVMEYAWEVCRKKNPELLMWGETGPRLLGEAVSNCEKNADVTSPEDFCPVPYDKWEDLLLPNFDTASIQKSYAIHLWNEMWRRFGRDKDASYPEGSIYEKLKRRYLSFDN